ncbi:MAG: cysteine--tRNA ligase [Desulfobacterales bacterium]|nr:cysteine--tRNA ligase [Desulfobacterales bacterium]
MPIRIYNTKTGSKTVLEPLTPGEVKLYVCGITAYDYCHIGHGRSALAFDMIVRYLRFKGYKVVYIRNFTDIDDKIINRAREARISTEELSERFIRAFHEDMESLGVLLPTMEPRATEHLPEIIAMIEELVARGLAYQVDGDVYYSVQGFPRYGQLSGRSLEDMLAGARISINESKKNPMDFALWKSSKPGEPTWDSPWGPGRPGWHIECSAMSRRYLGHSFDLHGGGKDLIFPHHENEIAQSEGASGKPFVNIWIHHGFVTIKDEKMSKSLGNFLTIREVLADYPAEVLRLFVFSSHYRTPIDYSDAAMRDAGAALDRLYECLAGIDALPDTGRDDLPGVAGAKAVAKLTGLAERFCRAMDNDFNTAQGLGQIFDAVKTINKILRSLPGNPATADLELLRRTRRTIVESAGIMGVLGQDPRAYIQARQGRMLAALDIDRKTIEELIRTRDAARRKKDWATSDAIRDQLLARHIEIKDGPEGTTWRVRVSEVR